MLEELCRILGWQGGTIHQALAEVRRMKAVLAVVDEIEEYLDDCQDVVDGSYGEPRPNRAMSLLAELRRVK